MKYLTADELKNAYRNEAHAILDQCAGKSVRDLFAVKVFNQYHDLFFKDRARTKIFDLGSASGTFLRQLHSGGYRELYGVDLDDYVLAENKPMLKEFRTADLNVERLPWPDESFDAVTAWCVLPHLENPFHAVREVRRVMKPGGLFVFTVPHLSSRPSTDYFVRRGDFRSYRPTNNHIVLFTQSIIKKTILRYFELVDTEYHFRPKIFRHPAGKVRFLAYWLAGFHPRIKKALDRRWAYNAVYILRKPER